MSFSQFTEVFVNMDYSNINENEMFIFENFDLEIQSFFTNNYFYEEPDELEINLDINFIIENINNVGSEKIINELIKYKKKYFRIFYLITWCSALNGRSRRFFTHSQICSTAY